LTTSKHKILGDTRGKLIAIESQVDIPFEVKRVFYIYGMPEDVSRGGHSHYKTKQYLIAIKGQCKVTLDNGVNKTIHLLNKPNIGLFQDCRIWGTMHDFSPDCILLVLASDFYNSNDYLHNYVKFKSEVLM